MDGPAPFADRRDAGRRLAEELATTVSDDSLVLGLPRGGIPVAAEVAKALGAPLEAFVARKVGAPGREEYGIGAIAEGVDGYDELVVTDAAWHLGLDVATVDRLVAGERAELVRRVARYRGDRPLPSLAGADVVLVDDGLATGVTAEAALRALRRARPRRLVLAVPVCAREAQRRLAAIADTIACAASPDRFRAVGAFYEDFGQTADSEVLAILDAFPAPSPGTAGSRREATTARWSLPSTS